MSKTKAGRFELAAPLHLRTAADCLRAFGMNVTIEHECFGKVYSPTHGACFDFRDA